MQTKLSISQTTGTTTIYHPNGALSFFADKDKALNNLGITSDSIKKVSTNQYFVNYVITQNN